MRPKLVTKFGGTSLSTPSSWSQVLSILESCRDQTPLVVVSAVGSVPGRPKVTDLLLEMAEHGGGGGDMQALRKIHVDLLEALGLSLNLLDDLFNDLALGLLELPNLSVPQGLDLVMGFGERLSARMMAAVMSSRGWDAKSASPQELALISDDHFQDASILESGLEEIVKRIFRAKQHLVVPGYVAVTADGRLTTLGRGGSDYTAAVLGAALKRDVEIWTDVSGVAVSNPSFLPPELRQQGHPYTVPELSHEEAYQMAAFGSKVLYQKCLAAARMASRKGRHLRLLVRNTFQPQQQSTLLTGHRSPDGRPKGITALEGVQLLTIYLEREEDYRALLAQAEKLPDIRVLMASYSTGRASFVFDRLTPEVEQLERAYQEAHLSRDQVLIKVVGDAMGENHAILATIHRAIARVASFAEMPPIHKSPQLLTDSTFECVALKRYFRQVVLQLYRDLFLGDQVQIGMLGLGTVGGGVLYYAKELFSQEKSRTQLHFPIAAVRDLNKSRPDFHGELTDRPEDVVNDPRVDIVVEVMGGLEPARTLILQALRAGKHVVTANKAVLAEHGHELFRAATQSGTNLAFEGSVCGEIPVLEVVRKMPSSQDVEGLTAIMNGTSNFILTLMDNGQDYAEALAEAQAMGFAEADPTLDVSGADAAQKLSILSSLVFHTPIDWKQIQRQGLQDVRSVDLRAAAKMSMTIRPVALARRHEEGLELWVRPALVDSDHTLFYVRRETNAVALKLRDREDPFTLVGKGAGALPTARSVLRDILEVSRQARHHAVDLPFFHEAEAVPLLKPDLFEQLWCVRFTVADRPGIFAKLATALGHAGLSIREAYQEDETDERAHVVLLLKKAAQGRLSKALQSLEGHDWLLAHLACPVLS